MKKVMVAFLALVMFATSAVANPDRFWGPRVIPTEQGAGTWSVYGTMPNRNLNGQCFAQTTWTDGTTLNVIKDLHDDELYVQIYNPDWYLPEPGHANLDFNVAGRNERLPVTFVVIGNGNNTIHIRHLDRTNFMQLVYDARMLGIDMEPNGNPNLYMTMMGSRDMIAALVDCYKFAKSKVRR